MTTNNVSLKQEDIFSLFGIEDPYAKQKEKEDEERMKKQAEIAKKIEESKKNATSNSKSKVDVFEVNADTIIYFYTETIQISDYFTTEELENGIGKPGKNGEIKFKKITEDDVKSRLKKEYPVIEAGAELVYIKKKNFVSVVLKAKKKGNINCTKESDSISGSFPSKKKIPFSLLKDFIAISKYFSDKHTSEVHADIYFDVETNEFFMDIPVQRASVLWVEVTEDARETYEKFSDRDRQYVKVMEIHSHHLMQATPSSQDNEGERLPLLYAIVGRVGNFFPELTVRTFDLKSGRHIPLDTRDIFEYPFTDVPSQYDLNVVEVIM